jgi:predicted transcriptional regulator
MFLRPRARIQNIHAKACYTETVKTRNVTLAVPEHLLRRLKIVAVKRETSLSAMLSRMLEQMADSEEGYAEARRGMLNDLKEGYDLGTKGRIGWTRDSLHER